MRPIACVSSDVGAPLPIPKRSSDSGPTFGATRLRLGSDRRDPLSDHAGARPSATINSVSGVGENRDVCLGLVEKYQDRRLADRVFDLAWTHSQVVLRQLNATQPDAQLYGHLASSVIYANASLRAEPNLLMKNQAGGDPDCGATPFPGIYPSCCCRLETPPASTSYDNSFKPMPIGV